MSSLEESSTVGSDYFPYVATLQGEERPGVKEVGTYPLFPHTSLSIPGRTRLDIEYFVDYM